LTIEGAFASAARTFNAEGPDDLFETAGRRRRPDPSSRRDGETIEGSVDYTGKLPRPQAAPRGRSVLRQEPMTDPAVLVKNGKLENAGARHKGAKEAAKPPSTPVGVDQKDCMYDPRSPRRGRPEDRRQNGDPILHNVHTYWARPRSSTRACQRQGPAHRVRHQGEGVIKWKCDVHPGCAGTRRVQERSQAITKTAPQDRERAPGKYTVESWHEKYGTKTRK